MGSENLRFALRQIARRPSFALTAIVVLGLGLCAGITMFAFVDAALIRPLPYRDSARLVGVYESIPLCRECDLSIPDYLDWRRLNHVLSSFAIYQHESMSLTGREGVEEVPGARVSDAFFRTLGVRPMLGRDFYAGEDVPSARRTAILSYGAWQRRFGGNPAVLGQTITLDDQPETIVGVLPRNFEFAPLAPADFYLTVHAEGGCDLRRSCHGFLGVARLRESTTAAAADADMKTIAAALAEQYPDSNRGQGALVVPLVDVLVGNIRPVAWALLGGAMLLLLIAGVNVCSLLLVRAQARRQEMAVRSALGASRRRLLGQLLVESLALVVVGAVLGVLGAEGAIRLLLLLIPSRVRDALPLLQHVGINARVAGFAALAVLAAAAVFTLIPARSLAAASLIEGSGQRAVTGTVWRRLGSKLVVLELAAAMVLLAVAGLMAQSLAHLMSVPLGMNPEHLAVMRVSAPTKVYKEDQQQVNLEHQILDAASGLPGVVSASVTSLQPVAGGNTVWILIAGRPRTGEHNEVGEREVGAAYFSTLQAPILRGRAFGPQDNLKSPRVAVIDRAMAEKYFPREDPVGRQILYGNNFEQSLEVVGVVDDIKEAPLDHPTWPTLYVDFDQDPRTYLVLLVRTAGNEHALLPELSAAVHKLDSSITTYSETSMGDLVNDSQAAWLRRAAAWVVGAFAAAALLLSVVGLYGVLAYSCAQRRREIGVRMSLGATPASIYGMVMREAANWAALGLAIGGAAAVASASAMGSFLFGIRSWDARTLAGVAALLGGAALLASLAPAHRAAAVNPAETLRAE